MADYGYQYFSGANVVVTVEGMPILECAGIRLSEMESKRPIYGYSSRHFDGIADGQVLVEGALIINYVDHNYLFRAIEKGLRDTGQALGEVAPPILDTANELRDQLANEGNAQTLLNQYFLDPFNNQEVANAMRARIWTPLPNGITKEWVPNPHDSYGGIDIKITFGDREAYNFYEGLTNCIVKNVHFLGRGFQIAIDESVIVEEYPFLARNISHLIDSRTLSYDLIEGSDGQVQETTTINN